MQKSLQKTISKMTNSSKHIQNIPTWTHKKRQILFHRFLDKYALFLTPSFFEGAGETMNSRKLCRGVQFFKKSSGQKERGEKKYKTCSLLAVMVTDTIFRKSSLENLFFKVVVTGTSKYWSYHAGLLVFCLKWLLQVLQWLYIQCKSIDWSLCDLDALIEVCCIYSTYLFLCFMLSLLLSIDITNFIACCCWCCCCLFAF